jgi:hypothetical protein
VALLLVGVLGALSGCDNDAGPSPSSTARFADAASMGTAVSEAVRAENTYRVRMAQSSNSVTVEYFVELREGGQNYAITVTHPQEWVTVIAVDDTYYRQRGTDSASRDWEQIPFETVRSDPDLGALVVEADWPARFLAMGAAEEFTAGAPTSQDGTWTTTYTLVLGPEALEGMLRTDLLLEEQRQQLPSVLAGQSATVEVTVGEDDLPRTVVWSYGTASTSVSTHYAFSDWSTTTVVAPDLG